MAASNPPRPKPPPVSESVPPDWNDVDSLDDEESRHPHALIKNLGGLGNVLEALASLKLTVLLLAMAIFIIVAGTFAQVEKDIWQVVDDYFRINFSEAARTGDWFGAVFARIDFDIFFPPAFVGEKVDDDGDPVKIWGLVYFPKGWLIGLAMSVNLLAAHLIRFKIQARGARLGWGLGALAAGVFVTLIVIQSGFNSQGIQQSIFAISGEQGVLDWRFLWRMLMVGIATAFLAALYGAIMIETLPVRSRVWFGGLAAAIGVLLGWLLYQGADAQLGDPSLRILWQLIKATFAGGVLLVGCFLLFRKRAGVVLLHAGIGLMMFSELLVGTTAKEARMSIFVGQTINYVFDLRTLELAVIEPGSEEDKVSVISDAVIKSHLPVSRDEPGETISLDELPFDLRIIRYYPNAELFQAQRDEELIATSGTGTLRVALPIKESTGVDNDAAVDTPAAYIQAVDKSSGSTLGTYLTSVVAGRQAVFYEGKRYDIALRFEREYLPYEVTLNKATRENYIGTNQPKDYSSDIFLRDNETGQELTHHIWMNNPLRYRNRTFYQSGFNQTANGTISTLQVVTNSGWMLPYVACMIVAVGMLAHFGVVLVRYLRRRGREAAKVPGNSRGTHKVGKNLSAPGMPPVPGELAVGGVSGWLRGLFQGTRSEVFARWFPLGVVAICAIWILSTMRSSGLPDDGMDLEAFGKLPVVYEGRVKPFDTLARTSLRRLSTKQTFYNDKDERTPAIRWLLDLMSGKSKPVKDGAQDPNEEKKEVIVADDHKVIRIDNPDVVELLGLEWVPRHLYSRREVDQAWRSGQIRIRMSKIEVKPTESLTTVDKKLVEVSQSLNRLYNLERAFFLPQNQTNLGTTEANLIRSQVPFATPVDLRSGQWRPFATAVANVLINQNQGVKLSSPGERAAAALERIFEAYRQDKPKDFNRAVVSYRRLLEEQNQVTGQGQRATAEYDQAKHDFESFFNRAEPFYYSSVLYVLAGLLAVFAWLGWSGPLNRASFWLLSFTLVLHTLALAGRMYISGRPPVTNLYTTGIFISWGCVLIGLILERWSKLGLGNVIAAACGFGGLLIAHLLTTSVANFRGDTFTVMQAVLDTQFWLATHVVIINMGYAASGLAGGFGMLYILLGICTPNLSKQMDQHLTRMTYGTLCFAIFFSFIGTVLGGLWADDSWGRFWGWDPKENGALIIVLWNAIVLHARWGNMVKDRGLAVLCVLGNICVTWSWFMVNELGVGLHSYGFTEGVLAASAIVVIWHGGIAALGTFWPKESWWSMRARKGAVPIEQI